jgi:hypothetical protein
MRKFYVFTILLCISLSGLKAQEAISASGGSTSGTGGSASYSAGQLVYTANTGTNGSVAQGVQQPYEISVVSRIEEFKGISLQCFAYPNPAKDFLTLKVECYEIKDLFYQLFDIKGKLLEIKRIEGFETSISMQSLVPSTYFLKVIQADKEVKTFKIVKN